MVNILNGVNFTITGTGATGPVSALNPGAVTFSEYTLSAGTALPWLLSPGAAILNSANRLAAELPEDFIATREVPSIYAFADVSTGAVTGFAVDAVEVFGVMKYFAKTAGSGKGFWANKSPEERTKIFRERAITRGARGHVIRDFVKRLIPEGEAGKRAFSPQFIQEELRKTGVEVSYKAVRKQLENLCREGMIRAMTSAERGSSLKKAFKLRDADTLTVQVKDFIKSLIPQGRVGDIGFSEAEIEGRWKAQGKAVLKPHTVRMALARLRREGIIRSLTFEERSELAKKVWARKSKAEREADPNLAGVRYLESLPLVNEASDENMQRLFEDLMKDLCARRITSSRTALYLPALDRYDKALYVDDIRSEYEKAIWHALLVWDRVRDLSELAADSIILHFFSEKPST